MTKQKKKPLYRLPWSRLRFCALLCLLLPALIFLLGFVRLVFAVPAAAAMLVAFAAALRVSTNDVYICVSRGELFALLFISVLWCWLGGQGGLFFQTDDWHWRNAIFRDLIMRGWPVYLPTIDAQLVYYVGHWLPPACVAKLVLWISGSSAVAWRAGNIALWIWTSLCVFLVFLLLFGVAEAQTRRNRLIAAAVMIGFSGMDIIGCILKHWTAEDYLTILHLEWWKSNMQFSSNTTCLFWVFNQAVPIWLAFMLFMREKNARCYAFIVVCALISAPIPCVGLAALMLCQAVTEAVCARHGQRLLFWLRSVFSVPNVLAVCSAFPFILTYYLSNMAVESTSQPAHIKLLGYIAFMALECGFYYVLLLPEHFREPMFYVSAIFLMLCPFIHIGKGTDFCMRASIPPLLYLMTLVIHALITHHERNSLRCRITVPLLVVCLLIGSATPCMEVFRGFYKAAQAHTLILPADDVGTVDSYLSDGSVNMNFVSVKFGETFFFKYLSKRS